MTAPSPTQAPLVTRVHTVDPKFTYWDKRTQKQVVRYEGLLDAAHRSGLMSISTALVQGPHADNDHVAIVSCIVRQDLGDGVVRSFSGLGDAGPKSVSASILPHALRMAETRAKARALRDMLNVGMVAVEELGGQDAAAEEEAPAPQPEDERLFDLMRDDEADPAERERALHAFYGLAGDVAQLNAAVNRAVKAGLPQERLEAAYRYHHHRLAKLVAVA